MIEPTNPPPPLAAVSDGLAARAAGPTLAFLTDDALRAVYDRIEVAAAHVDACCANDRCRYADGYQRLYDVLELAGLPDELRPLDRAQLEDWLPRRPRPTA